MRLRFSTASFSFATVMALVAPARGAGIDFDKGIDHAAVLVRPENYAAARERFAQLGFSVTPTLRSPVGVDTSLLWMSDLGYLEIATPFDSNPNTAPYVGFVTAHEGLMYFGLDVHDAAATAAFLTSAGYPNTGQIPALPLTVLSTGEPFSTAPLWQSILLTQIVAPGNSAFFIDNDASAISASLAAFPSVAPRPHPNTAQRIEATWVVVNNLESAVSFYKSIGADVSMYPRRISYLGAKSAHVRFNHNTVTLLEPQGPGPSTCFHDSRGEGVLGVSIQVANVDIARERIKTNTGVTLAKFRYGGRWRILIPASLAFGTIIELVE